MPFSGTGSRKKGAFCMLRQIHTGGIYNLYPLEGSSQWYWGMDCTGGDLYEAEELFTDNHKVDRTRLVFVRQPDGRVMEPIPSKKGQYFGRPLFYENKIILFVADFPEKQLRILSYDPETEAISTLATLPRSITEDCYNLQLKLSPLMLVRQGQDNTLEILFPMQKTYAMDLRESFRCRHGDELYFETWYEDPDYRDEIVIRDFHTGNVLKRLPGILMTTPDGEIWMLD